jgi:hypothetical protein
MFAYVVGAFVVVMRYVVQTIGALVLTLALVQCAPAPTDDGALPTLMILPSATPAPQNLMPWQAQAGTVLAQETQIYQFEGRAGQNIRLRVVLDDGDATALTIRLLSDDDTVLAEGRNIETTLTSDGFYTVRMSNENTEPITYDIGLSYPDETNPALVTTDVPQVVGIPTPTPVYATLGTFIQALNDGEGIQGRLDDGDDEHIYTYDAEGAETISVNMARIDGNIDPYLVLYDEEGRAVAVDDDSGGNGNARLLNVRLPQAGLYSVQVSGTGEAGNYALILRRGEETLVPDPPPLVTSTPNIPYATPTVGPANMDTRLVDHVPVIGNLRQAGDIQRFIFEANIGDTISLRIRPYQNNTLTPRFEIYNPFGELIANGNRDNARDVSGDSVGLFLWGIAIEEAGSYSIIVAGDNNTTGAFSISYGRGQSAYEQFQGGLPNNTPRDALLLGRGLRHVWQMDLKAGDVISVAVSPQDNTVNPVVDVRNQEGDILAQDDDSGGNRASLIQQIAIEQTGRYFMRVWDAGVNPQGAYTLIWRYINAAPTPTPSPRLSTLVALDDRVVENRYNFHPFVGQAGQDLRIRVQAKAGGTLDPVLVILDAEGREVAQADDSANSLNPDLRFTLPADGIYSVRVNGYLSEGAYTLTIAQVLNEE